MTVLQLNMCETIENDELDRIPSKDRANYWDVIALVISILSHLIDVGFDVNLAYRYFTNIDNNPIYLYCFILTLAFIIVPACINTAFSIRMYMHDGAKNKLVPHTLKNYRVYIIVLILQLAPVIRYVDSLKYALKSLKAEKKKNFGEQRKYYELMLKEDSDVALLRVLECFLEAAPQQILQITILLVTYNYGIDNTLTIIHQVLSIGSSFVSMAWSMASYHRSVRFVLDTKDNISKTGTAMQFIWHFLVTVSRILSISVLASIFPIPTAIGIIVHWLVMTMWLCCTEKTNFCNQNLFYDTIFFSIFGLVYTFTHVNLSEGKTRCKYIFFYVICFIENSIATAVWGSIEYSKLKNTYYYMPLIILNILSFIVGILFMIIYYKVFHPSKGMKRRHKVNNSVAVIDSD